MGQLVPGMDGRANEANNQLGGFGNTPTAMQGFNTSNLYVTGNVTGGRSFQGYSPIRDSSSLLLSLPSAQYGTFQRDTVGLNNVIGSRATGVPLPYFNPSTTAGNVAIINSGLTQPGSSLPLYTSMIPNSPTGNFSRRDPLDISLGSRTIQSAFAADSLDEMKNLPLLMDEHLYGKLRMSDETDALRESPVFGQSIVETRPLLLPDVADLKAGKEDPYALPRREMRGTQFDTIERPSRMFTNPYGRKPDSENMLAYSQELVSPTAVAPQLFEQPATDTPRDELTGRPLPKSTPYLASPREQNLREGTGANLETPGLVTRPPTTLTDPTGLTYAEMAQRAEFGTFPLTQTGAPDDPGLTAEPGTEVGINRFAQLAEAVEWLNEVEENPALRDQVSLEKELNEQYYRAVSIVENTASVDMRSLAGNTSTKIDELLMRAEDKVREGQYFQASTVYGLASSMDPSNPMVRLGHAHALLAAGEYLTAALQLSKAIEMYPAFGYLKIDLHDFVADENVFDIRRADLEQRLETKENYKLRFLLGYMEYYTGLEKYGIPNLEKAAELAPEGSPIANFPKMLKEEKRFGVKTAPLPDETPDDAAPLE